MARVHFSPATRVSLHGVFRSAGRERLEVESSLRFIDVFLVLDGHSPRSLPCLRCSRYFPGLLDVFLDRLIWSEAKTSGSGWKWSSGIARLLKFKDKVFWEHLGTGGDKGGRRRECDGW